MPPLRSRSRHWLEHLGIILVVCAVVAGLRLTAGFRELDLRGFDLLVSAARWPSPSPEILIVDFDDATARSLKTFPVPRKMVAQVLKKVSAGHPELIGLDFLLTESRPEGDREMASALKSAGNVVITSIMGNSVTPPVEPLAGFCKPDPTAPGYCQRGAFAVAFADIPVDSDGFVRRMYLLPRKGYSKLPFATALATNLAGQPIEPGVQGRPHFAGREVPVDADGLNTYLLGVWAPRLHARLSAQALLDPKFDPAIFAGKLVLIGQSSEMARDRHFTPMFHLKDETGAPAMVPGVDLQALAVSTLLQGRALRPPAPRTLWLLILLSAFLGVAAGMQLSPARAILASVAFAIVLFLAGTWELQRATWVNIVPCIAALLLAMPATFAWRFINERWLSAEAAAQRAELMSIFARYVSPDVADQIWQRRSEIALAGEERTVTVLFSDIRSFTALSAGKPSREVLGWLNEYFSEMGAVVSEHQGFLNKFIGDGLMAVYGVPLSAGVYDDAHRAVLSAKAMIARVEELNQRHAGEPDWPHLKIGIGLHTGPVTAGSVGAKERLEYSVIGETVNLASRLESLTKELHASVVMSADTYELVRSELPGLASRQVPVRGFEGKIEVFIIAAEETATA